MAKKTWDKLKPEEKIEDLRSDVLRIFIALQNLSSDLGHLQTRVSEVSKKLDSLDADTKAPKKR